MDLADELRQSLLRNLHLEDRKPEDFQPDTLLFGPSGIGLDSIDALELVMILKRDFKVEIPDRSAGEKAFRTFGTLLGFVQERRAEKA